MKLLLPYAKGGLLDKLHQDGKVLSTEYVAAGIEVEAVCGPILYGQVKEFQV